MNKKSPVLINLPPEAKRHFMLWRPKFSRIRFLSKQRSPQSDNLVRQAIVLGGDGKPRGLIARLKSGQLDEWIYYPKKEDVPAFFKARADVLPGGPSDKFLGCVGVMKIRTTKNEYLITRIQSGYRSGRELHLSRSLATKYGGWRENILAELFETAKKEGKNVSIITSNIQGGASNAFKKVAVKSGFEIKENEVLIGRTNQTKLIATQTQK